MKNEQQHKRSVLLMYITKVSGHRQATVAIQRSLRQLDSAIETPSINGFGYTYPILEKVVNRAYMGVIRRTPKVWDYLYDNPKIFKRSQSIKNFLHKTSHRKIAKLFERYHPNVVVCTQALPCGMVADYKHEHNLDITVIGVLTDFEPHSYWIHKGVDYYVVPTNEAKERLVTKGVDPGIIKVFGIPIRSHFSRILDKEAIAKKVGVDINKPVLLIMGGGQGLGPIRDIVESLEKLAEDVQMIIISGINKKLVKWLNQFKKKSKKKIISFDYVHNVDELMEVSTLIVTKPGGMTTSEVLAKGLPMVIVNPIPGQEMRNANFLLQKGIAIQVHDPSNIGEEIDLLLKSPQKLADMRKAALENSRPHAAKDIAQLILNDPNIKTG